MAGVAITPEENDMFKWDIMFEGPVNFFITTSSQRNHRKEAHMKEDIFSPVSFFPPIIHSDRQHFCSRQGFSIQILINMGIYVAIASDYSMSGAQQRL